MKSLVKMRQMLQEYERVLEKAPRIRPLSGKGWTDEVPREAGVYVLWENDLPIYVGETSSLQLRMADLARPQNHTFCKKFSNRYEIQETGEIAIAMANRYFLSFVVVEFGRKEVEEYLILRWRNTLLNKPTNRLQHSPQYNWVSRTVPRRADSPAVYGVDSNLEKLKRAL